MLFFLLAKIILIKILSSFLFFSTYQNQGCCQAGALTVENSQWAGAYASYRWEELPPLCVSTGLTHLAS